MRNVELRVLTWKMAKKVMAINRRAVSWRVVESVQKERCRYLRQRIFQRRSAG
jgi:hypothetical protein